MGYRGATAYLGSLHLLGKPAGKPNPRMWLALCRFTVAGEGVTVAGEGVVRLVKMHGISCKGQSPLGR